jgi:HKD family nuclease
MAKIQILNPNDQPTGKWRLINELRSCLVSDDYDTLLMAVAFAKTGPLLRLKTEIVQWLAKGKKIASVFGVNHRNTSRQALEFALQNFTKAHVLFHSDDFTYHPKMYLFIGEQKCKFFIGSHNLTVGGTETNWESGTEVSLNLPEDNGMFSEAMTAWDSVMAFSAPLTPELIREYQVFGKLADETEPRRRPAAVRPTDQKATLPKGEPPRLKLKIKPPSPLPKGLFIAKPAKAVATTSKVAGVLKQMPGKVATEALVIQIVPHHNGEVFLSKIAVDQNPDFFGFPFTGKTTPKKSGNPSYPQRSPDPIVDLKIYGDGATPVVHLPRLALNTVYYATKSEIRITVPPEVVRTTPALSILVMRQAPDDADFDYEMEVFPPTNPQFQDYLAVCNQTMPSGGRANPRRMSWL